MSKVLIFSDVHCHPHGINAGKSYRKLEDCLKALDWVFETARSRNIKNILFGGDLFHDRQKIDVYTYQAVFKAFAHNLITVDSPTVHLLLGNHDLWKYEKTDVTSVYPLSQLQKIKMISEPSTTDIDGYQVSWLPYTHDPEKDILTIKNDAKKKILIGHVAIDGAFLNSMGSVSDVHVEHDGEMKKVAVDIFDDWDHVFLGHYHGAQRLSSTVEYIGSPLQLSRGERDQEKHIIEFDMATGKKEYIVNTFSPKHIKISIDKLSTMSQADFTHHEIDIITDDVSSSKVVEARQQLEDAGAGGVRFVCLEKDITDQIKDIDAAKAILNTGMNMIEEYVKIANIKPVDDTVVKLDDSKLHQIGNEIISKSGMM